MVVATGVWEVLVVAATPGRAEVVKPGGAEVVTPGQAEVAMLEWAEVMLGQAGVVMIERGEETYWLAADLQWCR